MLRLYLSITYRFLNLRGSVHLAIRRSFDKSTVPFVLEDHVVINY